MNRFECRVCPYEAPLDKNYFEKKDMKQKEVDDVFGGKEEFANADSVGSKFFLLFSLRSDMSVETYRTDALFFSLTAQCPAESCHGERAYFFQLQIRSADEPMTTFLKVCLSPYVQSEVPVSDSSSVPHAVLGGEKIRVGWQGWEKVTCVLFFLAFILSFYNSEVQRRIYQVFRECNSKLSS